MKVAPQYATHWLPCGTCLGCREQQAATWAVRLRHETRSHSHSTFLTLTYDDENLPDGLDKTHLQRFWKRLRKTTPNKLKYFACGEYGDKTKRPHYHAAVFNLDKYGDERKYDTENEESQLLTETWGKGRVLRSELTPARISYVAGYVLKKAGYKKQIYCDEDGVELQAPFRKMSTALGKDWLKKYDEDLKHGYVQDEDRKLPIPRYYLDKIKEANPELSRYIQEQKDAKREEMPTPDRDRNKAAEAIRHQQIKRAKRDKI